MYGCFDVPGLTNCPDGESCQMLEPPTPSNPKPLRLVPLESILNCNFNSGIQRSVFSYFFYVQELVKKGKKFLTRQHLGITALCPLIVQLDIVVLGHQAKGDFL